MKGRQDMYAQMVLKLKWLDTFRITRILLGARGKDTILRNGHHVL